jgi:p-aminobenzoyl-glutamate transporter AbgT
MAPAVIISVLVFGRVQKKLLWLSSLEGAFVQEKQIVTRQAVCPMEALLFLSLGTFPLALLASAPWRGGFACPKALISTQRNRKVT